MTQLKIFLLALALTSPVFSIGVGQKVASFELKAVDGKQYNLENELKKKEMVAVIFIATKCPYSNAYIQRYRTLFDALSQRISVSLFTINSNDTESFDEVKAHAKENKFSFPVLKDEGHKVADLFGAEKTPEVFLVGKDKEILYHGRIDDDAEGKHVKRQDLLAAVDEVVTKKPISVKETKAFGCSIKRK